MTTSRRMPINIDVLDDLTEKISQNGNTTEIGGNVEIDGNLQVNGTIKQGQNHVLNSGNVKTLFGDKSIYGNGNIDIYRHVVEASSGTINAAFMFTIISSKNVKIDSLTDLKTVLGNKFTYQVTGFESNNLNTLWKMTETNVIDIEDNAFSLSSFTFTDTVTTV